MNIARALWADLKPVFSSAPRLTSLTLLEEDNLTVDLTPTAVAVILIGEFSAAHRTHMPHLSDATNLALYGICNNPAGHGHNYRAEVYLPPNASVPSSVWAEFDHKNLSVDIPDMI